MAAQDISTESEWSQEMTTLRAELKEWERAFSAANGGRKAGRDDIKNDPVIAAKYKAYANLRSGDKKESKKKEDPHSRGHKKRRHGDESRPQTKLTSTPRKATRYNFFTTPTKARGAEGSFHTHDEHYDSPSMLRKFFSPTAHRQSSSPLPLQTAIGPTPQRDGKVLGLFDSISASGGSTATPSSKRMKTISTSIAQTPSRRKNQDSATGELDEDDEMQRRHGRTPASASKKVMLSNLFATPRTLRYATIVEEEEESGSARRDLNKCEEINELDTQEPEPSEQGTPSFLRRSSSLRGSGQFGSPIKTRLPQKLVGRGLSELVRGLRDMEEDRLEDDMDALRELEAEEVGHVLVEDSQNPGVTGENAEDSTMPPSKVWKKKGQKRTTRRVNMRPVHSKPKPEPRWEHGGSESDDAAQKPDPAAAPTAAPGVGEDDEFITEPDSGSEYEGSGAKPVKRNLKQALSVIKNPAVTAAPSKEVKAPVAKGRKIKPEAHANYRSLKIRNKGGKGGAGRRRFGRR